MDSRYAKAFNEIEDGPDPEITDAEFEKLALAEPSVASGIAGKKILKVIARAPKLVNIVIQE